MQTKVIHILSTFESFKTYPFRLRHLIKNKFCKTFSKNIDVYGCSKAPQNQESLSKLDIFDMLIVMIVWLKSVIIDTSNDVSSHISQNSNVL